MANINLYKSHTWAFFASHNLFKIFTFQNLWPWKCRSKSCCTTFTMALFDGKYRTSYLTAIVMFAFFQRLLVKILIFANIIKCQKFWPWIRRLISRRRRTGFPPFDWKFIQVNFQNFSYLWIYVYAKGNTHTMRDRGDAYRQNLPSRFA